MRITNASVIAESTTAEVVLRTVALLSRYTGPAKAGHYREW